VADFDLSLVIRGDSSSMTAAGRQAESALSGVAKSEAESAREAAQLATETAKMERAQAAAALAALKLGEAQRRAGSEANSHGRLLNQTTADMNRQAFGARNLGQQFGDLGLSIAGGISPARAFGQQAGQIGYALSEMGGKAGAVGKFLTGPWGIALTIAAAVAAPFVEKLFEGADAAKDNADKLEKAAAAADSYGNAQTLLGKIIDLTTGKLKTQNAVLVQTIKLQAQANILAAQAEQKKATDTLKDAATPSFFESLKDATAAAGAADQGFSDPGEFANQTRNRLAPLRAVVGEYTKLVNTPGVAQATLDKALDNTLKRIDAIGASGRDVIKTKQQVLDLARTLNDQKANQLVLDAINGKGIDPALVPYKRDPKPKTPKKVPVDRTTPAEIERIAAISAQFDDAPTLIDAAAKATRELDKIIADLGKRKPPNFAETIKSAQAAKVVVANGLSKPYRDFIEDQQKGLAVQRLITEGRGDEAEALKIVQSLEARMGPLTQARKNAVLATVQAVKAEQREQEIILQGQQRQLALIGDIKSAVRDVFLTGAKGLADLPKRLLNAFANFKADQLLEKLFGDAFRDLQDRATGTNIVKDASKKMAEAVNSTVNPLADLSAAAKDAAAALGSVSGGASGQAPGKTVADTIGAKVGESVKDAVTGDDIVVKGQRSPESIFGDKITGLLGGVGDKPGLIGKGAAKSIGDAAGKAAGGAATGTLVNSFLKPLGKALGVKTSQTGAQIGGAIGSFIPIPGGDIIGSVIGSLIGGALKKTPRASATITSVNGDPTATGSSAKLRAQAAGLGGSVQEGIAQIAEQLGGGVGNFAVSIGTRKGKFRVDPSGSGKTKTSKGARDFGDDEAAAVAFAIQDAITDGAVTGLSAAVQQAIRSSSDINKALKEALKVQQVEELIAGVGGTLKKTFADFDREAAERVRIAKQYGLDVVKIEQVNAEQRAKLVDDALKARVGSLKDFLNSVQFGDLSEGTIADKRQALLAQRAQLEADALAGKDGAADKLAEVSANLIALTREGFGTAGGEFAGDRSTSISGVERVIAAENARVAEAAAQQQATTTAVETNNALTNETNNLLAMMNTNLGNLVGVAFGGGGGSSRISTERYTQLQ
jgi:hypothetical protein